LMSEVARMTWTPPDICPLPRHPNSGDA